MSKPEWKDAQPHANWLAMDADGIWCWFVNEPYAGFEHWLPSGPDPVGVDSFDIAESEFVPLVDWKETLEPRP